MKKRVKAGKKKQERRKQERRKQERKNRKEKTGKVIDRKPTKMIYRSKKYT